MEVLASLVKELEIYNNESLMKTQFHAGIMSDDILNRDRIFKAVSLESIKNDLRYFN